MSINMIGKNIAEFRKTKGITQGELAEIVGVSSQAVSKWESGGSPDIELLPVIADYFDVSIDKLFGRNTVDYKDLKPALHASIAELPMAERYEQAFKYCWVIEQSLLGKIKELKPYDEIEKSEKGPHSQILTDEGITLMSLAEDLPYFLIMPEPQCGWQKRLKYSEDHIKLLRTLSEEDVYKTLHMLNNRENKAFTPKLLEKNIGVTKERAIQILDELCKYKLVNNSEIELDDEIQKVYNFKPNPAFIAILALFDEIINRPNNFWYYTKSRNKPYLVNKDNV